MKDIRSPDDLPRRYYRAWQLIARRNRESGLYATDGAADYGAFETMKDQFVRDARKAVRAERGGK